MIKFILPISLILISFYGYSQKIKSIDTSESTVYYDSLGKPVKLLNKHNKKVVDVYNYKNKYDQQNRLVSLNTFIDTIQLGRTINRYEENKLVRVDNYQRTKFGTAHKYILFFYDKMDSLSRKIIFSNKGDTLKIISLGYTNNRLSQEVERDFEYKIIVQKEFTYTSYSKTETEYRIDINSRDTTDLKESKMYFNKHGDVIKNEEWGLNASILMVDDKEIRVSKKEKRHGRKGYLNTSTIEYQYDKFNNWIKLDLYYKGSDKTTTKRTITYF